MSTQFHEYALPGCTPTPLASYLKALGILRLVAEQADPDVRGWWQDDCFHLRTRLDEAALQRFFLEDYRPSPIAAPWNGGSGFYLREGKTKDKDPETGKKIKTGERTEETEATRRIAQLKAAKAPRLRPLAEAIGKCIEVLQRRKLIEAPDIPGKQALITELRGAADDHFVRWLDAAGIITPEKMDFSSILGSGGNDGNLDFSTAFQSAIIDLFDIDTGRPQEIAAALLKGCLFGDATPDLAGAGASQFAPHTASYANMASGFNGSTPESPWSTLFTMEGALLFAGSATVRAMSTRPRGSFPFTVQQIAAGSGAIGVGDEDSSRSAELWLPTWNSPAGFDEIQSLFCEGRANVSGKAAEDGLTFARAISTLGVSRGISSFQRLGFEARYGNMFITVPLGRFQCGSRPRPDLIADLDDWVDAIRQRVKEKGAPAYAHQAARALDDALFAMTGASAGHQEVQAALVAVGHLAAYLARSPKARKTDDSEGKAKPISPPPCLTAAWLKLADDKSPEFRVAAALASLGWARPVEKSPSEDIGNADTTKAVEPAHIMAAHFAPLDSAFTRRDKRRWNEERDKQKTADAATDHICGEGGLIHNLHAVLNRRLLRTDAVAEGGAGDPLEATLGASLADIMDFLAGRFDDGRCAALLAGLVWVNPVGFHWEDGDQRNGERKVELPLAYAACKPLFTPRRRLRTIGQPHDKEKGKAISVPRLAEGTKLPMPPGLVARLVRGDIAKVTGDALQRARASGLNSPLLARTGGLPVLSSTAIKGDRLAAALLIPLDDNGLVRVLNRAFDLSPANPTDTEAA